MANSKYIRLSQPQRARLARLLHMEYTARELADEIGCGVSQIRHAAEAGCPHRRTGGGHVRVVGDEFAAWYESLCVRRKQPLRDNEAYCLRCRAPVTIAGQVEIADAGSVERVRGRCPKCNAIVNRYRRVV